MTIFRSDSDRVARRLSLQAASSPEGFSIEWVDEKGDPVLEVYRDDEGGGRRILFGGSPILVDISASHFNDLVKAAFARLDQWEVDQRAMGFMDQNGKRKI